MPDHLPDLGEPRQGEKGISHKTRLRSRGSQCGPTDQSPPARIKVASGIRCKSAGVVPGFMIRLSDGADSFGGPGGLAGGRGGWPEVAGWFEQRAAQVLQEPQAGEVTFTPRQPAEARSGTARPG